MEDAHRDIDNIPVWNDGGRMVSRSWDEEKFHSFAYYFNGLNLFIYSFVHSFFFFETTPPNRSCEDDGLLQRGTPRVDSSKSH